MTKRTFLKQLKEKLSVLEESEVEDILKEYEDHIDMKIKEGKTEKEAVEDFGNIDELVKDILSAYKISSGYQEKKTVDDYLNICVDKITEFVKELGKRLKNKNGEDLLRLIIKFLVLLVIVWILKLPFMMLEGLGDGFFHLLPSFADRIIIVVWHILVWCLYIITSILVVYNGLKEFFDVPSVNSSSNKNAKKVEKIVKEKVSKEDNSEKTDKVEVVPKKERNVSFGGIFVGLLQAFLVLITLPGWFIILGLVIAIGFLLGFVIQGLPVISILVTVFGIFLIGLSLLLMLYHAAFKGGK